MGRLPSGEGAVCAGLGWEARGILGFSPKAVSGLGASFDFAQDERCGGWGVRLAGVSGLGASFDFAQDERCEVTRIAFSQIEAALPLPSGRGLG